MLLEYWKAKLICLFLGIKIDKKTFVDIEIKQFNKGLNKYGKTLKDCSYSAYDWNKMAIEEIIDLLMYAKKQNKKL